MWELDCEEGWVPKNWCFWTVVLEKTLESPLECKEMQPVHSKWDQSWDFFGKNDAKAEIPVLWPPHAKSWLIGKDSAAGRDWGQEEKRTTEDEMAGWHHWLNGRESEWTRGVGVRQGGLACCDSWGHKEWGTTERLNWTDCTGLSLPPTQLVNSMMSKGLSILFTAPEGLLQEWCDRVVNKLYFSCFTDGHQLCWWTAFGKDLWKWKIFTKSSSLFI